MKKTIVLVVLLSILVLSCHLFEDNDPLNGTWTLSTISGVPAALAGISGTLTVSASSSFTLTLTIVGLGTQSAIGTVAYKGGKTYTLSVTGGLPQDFTLSENDTVLTSAGGLAYTK